MIQVRELTKIYKSRKGGSCTALDHISFTLPDRGFVFVVGKSGSGKTTLLSLLGGLDTITSGTIAENGRELDKFGLKEQVCYRNSTVGFIFQDFHLIDSFTVRENVALALQLQGEASEARVERALEETGLSDCGDRYPKELSGGQKQRVAIARAIVKQPSVILADEPTGNLDSKTTVQILDLLKALSREKLVVIVSHNLSDAQTYADELLELSDGRILQHVRRNEAFDPHLRVEGETLVIPGGETFAAAEVQAASAEMARGTVRKVRQETERFCPCAERAAEAKEARPLEKKHIRPRDLGKTAVKFTRRGWIRAAVYAVIFAAIMVVLGLSQLIMNFNGGEVVASELSKRNLNCSSFLKYENDAYESTDTRYLVDVEENDFQKFYDAGYEGKVYPLIHYSYYLLADMISTGQVKLTFRNDPFSYQETFGLLITEESFVERQFGELKFAALSEDPKDYGIYITDFSADIILRGRGFLNYDSILNDAAEIWYRYAYINGVIDTGYKERYKDVLQKLTSPRSLRRICKNLWRARSASPSTTKSTNFSTSATPSIPTSSNVPLRRIIAISSPWGSPRSRETARRMR